jgi:hypothetical protein
MKLGPSDRSEETQTRYQHDVDNNQLTGLDNEPSVAEHQYWRLIVNKYPYDKKWCTSMMLVLKRSGSWEKLSDEEVLELHILTNAYLLPFDRAVRNGETLASVLNYPHIHLLKGLK